VNKRKGITNTYANNFVLIFRVGCTRSIARGYMHPRAKRGYALDKKGFQRNGFY
jgi:hypothetical protein